MSVDNTVGRLTQFQKSVVVGTILGDGYLRRMPGRKDSFLEINHSLKQKSYVDWKYSVLENMSGNLPKARRSNGIRVAYRFYTRQLPELTELQQEFYQDGVKVITSPVSLDPVMLAVWYMDDGSKCRLSDVYLNTQQFDQKSQELLIDSLARLEIKARMNRDKNYCRLRIMKNSIKTLFEMINPYVISSMRYKLS